MGVPPLPPFPQGYGATKELTNQLWALIHQTVCDHLINDGPSFSWIRSFCDHNSKVTHPGSHWLCFHLFLC